VVISADSISDMHGRTIHYSKDYYIAEKNELVPVIVNIGSQKILENTKKEKLGFVFEMRNDTKCYEITTYKEELAEINALIGQ
jgi:hypothetical protein